MMSLLYEHATNGVFYIDKGVVIDIFNHSVVKQGKHYSLSRLQYRLMLCLASQANQLVKKDALMQKVWGTTHVSLNDLHLCVSRTRKVLEESPSRPKYLRTIHGQGYILRVYFDVVTSQPALR